MTDRDHDLSIKVFLNTHCPDFSEFASRHPILPGSPRSHELTHCFATVKMLISSN